MYDFYKGDLLDPNDDYSILKINNCYDDKYMSLNVAYDFNDKKLEYLKIKYSLKQIAGKGSDYIKQIRLMNWVRKTLTPGLCFNTNQITTDYILKNAQNGLKCNCFMFALVLTDIFLAMGYRARLVRCMPLDLRFNECHCMVLVYSDFFNKNIAFDPALRGLYFGDSNIPLDIKELKNLIINKGKVRFLWNYIENMVPDTVSYLTKNLVRFEYYLNVKYFNHNNKKNQKILSLMPLTMPVSSKKILKNKICLEYIITHNEELFWSL